MYKASLANNSITISEGGTLPLEYVNNIFTPEHKDIKELIIKTDPYDIITKLDWRVKPLWVIFPYQNIDGPKTYTNKCKLVLHILTKQGYGMVFRDKQTIRMEHGANTNNPLLNKSFSWKHDRNTQVPWNQDPGKTNGYITFGKGTVITPWAMGTYKLLSTHVVEAEWDGLKHTLVFDEDYSSFLSVRMNNKYVNKMSGGIELVYLPKSWWE
jgi:hypothetical protein